MSESTSAAPKYADWFQELLDHGLSMVPGEMDPQKFERRAYDGHISYEIGGTDGWYIPEPFEAWVVQFRKSPVSSLYYGNDNRHILAPYVEAYKGWVASFDGLEPYDSLADQTPADRIPHPPVWPNYIDNPVSDDSDQGAEDEVLDEADSYEMDRVLGLVDPSNQLRRTGQSFEDWVEFTSPGKGLVWIRLAEDNPFGLEVSAKHPGQ